MPAKFGELRVVDQSTVISVTMDEEGNSCELYLLSLSGPSILTRKIIQLTTEDEVEKNPLFTISGRNLILGHMALTLSPFSNPGKKKFRR